AKAANGNVAPVRHITGSVTALNQPVGVWLDAARTLYVANFGSNTLSVFAPGANGNVAPAKTISGTHTLLNGPVFVVLDSVGKSYVANWYGASISVFAA